MAENDFLEKDILSLIGAMPGVCLVLLPDAPWFTILAATAGYLKAVAIAEIDVLHHGLLEMYGMRSQTFVQQLSASLNEVIETKKDHRLFRQAIGAEFFNLHQQPVFGNKGELRFIIHTLEKVFGNNDLTEQQLAQEKRRLEEQLHRNERTNQAITDILYSMHLDSRKLTYINHPFEEKLGYTREEIQKMEDSLFNMMYADDIPAMLVHIEEMRGVKDGEFLEVEYRLRHADGSLHWFRDRDTVFKRDEKGNVLEKIGIAQDITDHKSAEQALKESNINLRYANDKLQQFASIASHDLQEPLRKVRLYSNRLVQGFSEALPAEGKDVIRKIKNAADQMSHLISDVLQYSKIAYGVKEFEQTNLDAVLKDTIHELAAVIEETGAEITHLTSLPIIGAIPVQMRHLFYNLLTNALKYRKEGVQPHITISSRTLSVEEIKTQWQLRENFLYIEIRVADNGIGFEQEFAEQIFQLFERLHTAYEFEGTGIGLALCKKVIENHKGHIFAVSEEGKGTSFYIILPINVTAEL